MVRQRIAVNASAEEFAAALKAAEAPVVEDDELAADLAAFGFEVR